MSVAIIDYGSGNLRSVSKAFERAAREAGISVKIEITDKPEIVAKADRVVLPGVGAFADCKQGLLGIDGMYEALEQTICQQAKPYLGICVGMQLMATRGLEHGVTEGFDWIKGDVCAIQPDDPSLKVPHMGWNTLNVSRDHALLEGIKTGSEGLHAYFVHSYHLMAEEQQDIVATANYGGPLTAMVARDNMVGTQFHPEKSQQLGLALITNFLKWTP